MKILDLSGASTKIAGHAGACRALYDLGYRPDIIVGVSSGALASVPVALGLHNELEKVTTSVTLDDFFDVPPVDKNGKIRVMHSIAQVVKGRNSIGKQNVSKAIRKVITEEIFEHYRMGSIYPECYAVAVNIDLNRREYFRIKSLTYQQYLLAMEATSAIPFATEPVKIGDYRYYDGGVLDHIGGVPFMEYVGRIPNMVVSVFSRPENLPAMGTGWHKDMFGVAARLWSLIIHNISKDDEVMQKAWCRERGTDLVQIFMPSIAGSLYDTDKEKMAMLYEAGYVAASEAFANG